MVGRPFWECRWWQRLLDASFRVLGRHPAELTHLPRLALEEAVEWMNALPGR